VLAWLHDMAQRHPPGKKRPLLVWGKWMKRRKTSAADRAWQSFVAEVLRRFPQLVNESYDARNDHMLIDAFCDRLNKRLRKEQRAVSKTTRFRDVTPRQRRLPKPQRLEETEWAETDYTGNRSPQRGLNLLEMSLRRDFYW
jgi:hypothetical protein